MDKKKKDPYYVTCKANSSESLDVEVNKMVKDGKYRLHGNPYTTSVQNTNSNGVTFSSYVFYQAVELVGSGLFPNGQTRNIMCNSEPEEEKSTGFKEVSPDKMYADTEEENENTSDTEQGEEPEESGIQGMSPESTDTPGA